MFKGSTTARVRKNRVLVFLSLSHIYHSKLVGLSTEITEMKQGLSRLLEKHFIRCVTVNKILYAVMFKMSTIFIIYVLQVFIRYVEVKYRRQQYVKVDHLNSMQRKVLKISTSLACYGQLHNKHA